MKFYTKSNLVEDVLKNSLPNTPKSHVKKSVDWLFGYIVAALSAGYSVDLGELGVLSAGTLEYKVRSTEDLYRTRPFFRLTKTDRMINKLNANRHISNLDFIQPRGNMLLSSYARNKSEVSSELPTIDRSNYFRVVRPFPHLEPRKE